MKVTNNQKFNKITNDSFIISAYEFSKIGQAKHVSQKSLKSSIANNNLTWVHIDGNSSEGINWVQNNIPYTQDHLITESLFAEETRPRIIEFEQGMLVILRGIDIDETTKENRTTSIRIWIDETRVISVQKRVFTPVVNLINKIEMGQKVNNSGTILRLILEEIISSSWKITSNFDSELQYIEEKINEGDISQLARKNVSNFKRQSSEFKRYILPQKEIITRLATGNYNWIDDWAIRYFQEYQNKISILLEEFEEIKERAQIINQDIFNINSEKTNKSAYKISLIASIFLPLGFITGLFGMNIQGIPLSDEKSGFYIITYFMVVIFGALYLVLRNKK